MAYDIKEDKNPTSINILKLQRYNFNFFSLEEIVFFEYLLVKGKAFNFSPFYHSTNTISSEIGIKRTKLDSIIAKFTDLNILTVEIKGFPKVKYFAVDFVGVYALLSKIYQCSENGKLSAEFSKLLLDFYKPLVDTYQQKNNIRSIDKKDTQKETKEKGEVWTSFSLIFFQKIKEWQVIYNLNSSSLKHEEIQLYNVFETYGEETVNFIEQYFVQNERYGKLSDFLKPDKLNSSKNAFIENLKLEERKDAKKLLETLVESFNNRRSMKSTDKKGFSHTSLIINDSVISKATQALREVAEHAIRNAFIAYADSILTNAISPRKVLPYFFTHQYGTYSVIEQYLDHFNVNYSYSNK